MWRGDVAAVVDLGEVVGRHSDAQHVLGNHDLGEIAVGYGKGHVQIHCQIEGGPVAVDLVVWR